MPFEIVRNDIVNMQADAIVNSANPRPVIGLGTDSSIHAAAGPRLLEARKQIGSLRPGEAAVTPGFNLKARFVIHTVGPVWQGGAFDEMKKLRSCYDTSLKLAWERGCQSIAFPLISTNNYGFPRDKALQIAISAFSEFLLEHEMQIYLVVFDRKSFQLSEKLFRDVASYIDDHYVNLWERETYGPEGNTRRQQMRRAMDADLYLRESEEIWDVSETLAADKGIVMPIAAAPSMASETDWEDTGPPPALDEMLRHTDAGFSETLLKLIDQTGKKDSVIYKKANVSKQHFSKIRNNPYYQPTKATAVAFAIALELNLEQTRDLIGRAGYALTNSSKFDVIIMYFIRSRNYDMYDINSALFEFDQTLLGA